MPIFVKIGPKDLLPVQLKYNPLVTLCTFPFLSLYSLFHVLAVAYGKRVDGFSRFIPRTMRFHPRMMYLLRF